MLSITDYENFDIVVGYGHSFAQIQLKIQRLFTKKHLHRNDIKLLLTNIEIAEKDIQLAKGGLQPNLTAFYGFNSRVSYADRFTGNGIFNDVPIGFVPSTNETVLDLLGVKRLDHFLLKTNSILIRGIT